MNTHEILNAFATRLCPSPLDGIDLQHQRSTRVGLQPTVSQHLGVKISLIILIQSVVQKEEHSKISLSSMIE